MQSGFFHRAESRVYIWYNKPLDCTSSSLCLCLRAMSESSAEVNLKWYLTLLTHVCACVCAEVKWCHTFIWIMKWRTWQRTQVDWHTFCCLTYVEMFLKRFNVHVERCVWYWSNMDKWRVTQTLILCCFDHITLTAQINEMNFSLWTEPHTYPTTNHYATHQHTPHT